MIPSFSEDDYYQGIDKAVNVVMDLCSGKFTQDEYAENGDFPLWFIIIFIIAIILIFRSPKSTYTRNGSRNIWIPMGGGFRGSSGGGGGGFSGFGGGGFGGGGASGSW